MSWNGHPVIDADCHIREYWDLDRTYKDYMDPEYREKYAQFSDAVRSRQRKPGDVGLGDLLWPRPPGHPMGMYDGFTAPKREPRNAGNPNPSSIGNRAITGMGKEIDNACNWDPAIRLADMDVAHVDVSVMFASQSDGYCMLDDVGFESALQRGYHRFMNNYCSEGDGRLWWIANSNIRDIDETVRQLKHWANADKYFAGMFIPRACPDGAMLDHPRLHPIFQASQELDLPIWVHGGTGRPPLTPWVGGTNAIYHGLGGMYAMAGLVGGGVFDLFPTLRVGLFESGGGWLPWFTERLNDGFTPGSANNPLLKRTVREIVASGQLFVSIEAEEEEIEHAVEELGEDVWLFTTDYPHPGTPWPEGVPMVAGKNISESAKIKMFGTNAKRFLPRLA